MRFGGRNEGKQKFEEGCMCVGLNYRPNSGPFTLIKLASGLVATAFAGIVLPVPGNRIVGTV